MALRDWAIERHGRPRHFVSDQGAQFTGEAFRARLRSLAIRQRFGAVGQYGSIAIVERLWKTVKEQLDVRRWSIVDPADMQRCLDSRSPRRWPATPRAILRAGSQARLTGEGQKA